jgi:hypothetical protein
MGRGMAVILQKLLELLRPFLTIGRKVANDVKELKSRWHSRVGVLIGEEKLKVEKSSLHVASALF